jgi:hypothetical protein
MPQPLRPAILTQSFCLGNCRVSNGFWDVPISEQSLLACTVAPLETQSQDTLDGPEHLAMASKKTYNPCAGGDPVLAWLDMGLDSKVGQSARSEMPYNMATSTKALKRLKKKCKEAAKERHEDDSLMFAVRPYQSRLSFVVTGEKENLGLSVFALPANDIGLIKHAIYSSGTISAGFNVYDGRAFRSGLLWSSVGILTPLQTSRATGGVCMQKPRAKHASRAGTRLPSLATVVKATRNTGSSPTRGARHAHPKFLALPSGIARVVPRIGTRHTLYSPLTCHVAEDSAPVTRVIRSPL